MARAQKRSNKPSREKTTKKLKNDMRQHVLQKICKELYDSSQMNGSKKPYGSVAKIVNDMKADFPWMNRDVVNYAFKVYKGKMAESAAASDADSRTASGSGDTVASSKPKKAGRPVGSTKINKFKKDVAIRLCLDEVAVKYHDVRKASRARGNHAKKKTLRLIIGEAKKSMG